MKSLNLSRRTVLRGAGISVALPWLEAMTTGVKSARAAAPKRFLVFFSPNGSIRDAWIPTGTADNFQLSRILAPLEKHKSDIVILDGVDNVAATKGPGDDHQRGMGAMLTSIEALPGKVMGGCGTCMPAGLAGGPSVDQEIVARTKPPTKFPSLELGVQAGSAGTIWGYSNYKAAGQALPLDNSPSSVFNRVFTDLQVTGADNSGALKIQMERKSVLDAVRRNYDLLAPKLGGEDRKKMDQHMTAIRELEGRVLATGKSMAGKGCAKPTAPVIDARANDNFPKIATMQMDLMVMAMACDLARVGTIQFENSVGGTRFTWLGATRGHHDMSHDADSVADSKEMLTKINVWFSEQLAALMTKMKEIPEDGGTMLDNSLILWCNELARGNAHSHPDMPFVLAGRAGGKIKGGRWLKFGSGLPASHSNMLVSILNAMDVPATTFGNPAYCTGPLAGL